MPHEGSATLFSCQFSCSAPITEQINRIDKRRCELSLTANKRALKPCLKQNYKKKTSILEDPASLDYSLYILQY